MEKPRQCCEIGSYSHTVPMVSRGRRVDVDLCIANIVAALNAANIPTVNSCCGHGKLLPTVTLEDKRMMVIYPTIADGVAAVEKSKQTRTGTVIDNSAPAGGNCGVKCDACCRSWVC